MLTAKSHNNYACYILRELHAAAAHSTHGEWDLRAGYFCLSKVTRSLLTLSFFAGPGPFVSICLNSILQIYRLSNNMHHIPTIHVMFTHFPRSQQCLKTTSVPWLMLAPSHLPRSHSYIGLVIRLDTQYLSNTYLVDLSQCCSNNILDKVGRISKNTQWLLMTR